MRYPYRRRKRRFRAGSILLLVLLCATFLVSCVAGPNALWIKGFFGLDLSDYRSQTVCATLSPTDQRVEEMVDTLDILLAGSVDLATFSTTSRLMEEYRDAILNDLLRDHYSLYMGNPQLLSVAESSYPEAMLSTAIPAKDLEQAVKRHFGGGSIAHRDGDVYEYLGRSDTYTTVLGPWESSVVLNVLSAEETQNTYRLYFTLSDGEHTSAVYCGLFVKRADGSTYLRSLTV